MKLLLSQPNIGESLNKPDNDGVTPFGLVCIAYNANKQTKAQIEALLREKGATKASVKAPDSVCQQMIDFAKEGNVDALVSLLDEWKGNDVIHWADEHGNTPLYWACRSDHVDVVKLLLSQPNIGENINKANFDGKTPLAVVGTGFLISRDKKAQIEALLREKEAI